MLLLIDNYDSFTFNLSRYCEELGYPTVVLRNDRFSVDEIRSMRPQAIILSPGPGRPEQAGICLELIRLLAAEIPILGVCLGHQAIAQCFGGRIVAAQQVMHGKVSTLQHQGQGLLAGLPKCFQVGRYHSLVVDRSSLPEQLLVTAWVSHQGQTEIEIMALQHRDYPLYGIQFHPESILSDYGHKVMEVFLSRHCRRIVSRF